MGYHTGYSGGGAPAVTPGASVSVLQTNDFSASGAGYVQFGDLTASLNVSANSKIAVDACGNFKGAGASVVKFRITLDGGVVQQHAQQQWATGEGFSFAHLTGALAAGPHTVVVEFERTATAVSCNAASDPTNMGASLRLTELKA